MTEIRMIVTGPEEAYNDEAEFWHGNELMGFTVLHEGRLHLRIDPRPDGARIGATDFATWFATQPQGVGRSPRSG